MRLDKAAKAISTIEPLEQWHGVQPSSSKRFRFVFADISKGKGPLLVLKKYSPIAPVLVSLSDALLDKYSPIAPVLFSLCDALLDMYSPTA